MVSASDRKIPLAPKFIFSKREISLKFTTGWSLCEYFEKQSLLKEFKTRGLNFNFMVVKQLGKGIVTV